MRRPPEDDLFADFRARRDPAALAAVFDRLAPDLLRIAGHLTGRAAEAEDLVQQTFLLAIERADAWDADLGLYPWLIGILTNQARLRRRSAARQLDPSRLAPPAGEQPDESAARAELRAAIQSAVDHLGEVYQPVLHLHLFVGLNAKEIGDALGRPAGSVRTQLVRGLQHLRRALPVGLGVGATMLGAGRGLAAVRQAVLAGVGAPGPAALASAGAATAIGGFLTMKKAAVLAGVLALLGGTWMLWTQGGGRGGETRAPATGFDGVMDAAPHAQASGGGTTEADGVRTAVTPEPKQGSVRVTVRGPLARRAAPNTWFASSAGGAPLADAIVVAWRGGGEASDAHAARRARTGGDGTVILTEVEPGAWRVQASVGTRARSGILDVDVASRAAAECALDVVMAGTLHGRVVDRSGLAVGGAEVWAGDHVIGQAAAADELLRLAAVSGSDGSFTLSYASGEERIAARKKGYAASWSFPTAQLGDGEVVLVLGPGAAAVTGLVADRTGRPIADAVIGLQLQGEAMHRDADGTLLGPRLPLLLRSGRDGRFAAGDLAPGRYACRANAAGHAQGEASFDLAAAGQHELHLRLEPSVTLSGRVRGRGGEPLAGVYVWIERDAPDKSAATITTRTADDGRFTFARVPPPPFVVQAARQRSGSIARQAFAELPGAAACELVLDDLPGIRGRLRQDGGGALAGWQVAALDGARQSRASARTGSDGSFALHDLGAGAFTVVAHAGNGAGGEPACERGGVTPGGAPLDLVVPAPPPAQASVTGRVLDAQGRPLAGAWIEVDTPQGTPITWPCQTDAEGRFRSEGLASGRHKLTAIAPDCLRQEREVDLAPAQAVHLGDIVLAAAATLRVRFLRPDGSPWRHRPPPPWLQTEDGAWLLAGHAAGVDYAVEGDEVVATGIRPGRYLLHGPQGDELLTEARRVVLDAGATLRVEVPVQVGRRRSLMFARPPGDARVLHVEVTTAAGALVVRAECSRAAAGGFVHQQAYAPGRYTVTARADTGERWRGGFTVDAAWQADPRVDVPLVH